MCLHTLPHLTWRTVNDFPPHQDDRVSCVCVRAQSPRGLDLVACASNAVAKGGQKKVESHTPTHTHIDKNSKQGTLPSYPSRYEEVLFYLVKNEIKKARFARAPHYHFVH